MRCARQKGGQKASIFWPFLSPPRDPCRPFKRFSLLKNHKKEMENLYKRHMKICTFYLARAYVHTFSLRETVTVRPMKFRMVKFYFRVVTRRHMERGGKSETN